MHKRRVFAFVLIVTLATLAAWLWNDGRGGALGHGVAATSPTTSLPKSTQAPRWTDSQRLALGAALQGAFAPALNGAESWSLAVVDPGGQTIYDDRAGDAVAPASVQKLIVAASALDALGPNYRYHTIFAAAEPAGDGVLEGNLWLAGSGDPSLQSSDLRNGIAVLSRSGLRRIDGSVVVDATAISGPAYNPHWGPDDAGQDYAAPTSAISLDGDTVESADDGQPVWTPMQDVERYVADQTERMFRARGILVSTSPGLGAAPLGTVVLWNHKSAPLRDLEAHMLYVSDNHYAEQLLRTVGEEVTGESNDDGGVDAERLFLARLGVPSPHLTLVDGSGLSRNNRVAAITVARLLVAEEPSLYGLLPRGGRDGTIADYDFTTALGRVRAKSGHLSNVSSLAGYASTLHHGRVAFAFLIDGSPADPDASIVRAVDRLVEY
ncbi:MAG TPA: D-alanyl-D-alanine carboxypeptidase/D-alanyl-D-alanine-endopeptidase [Candidatus Cybelea sp.]|nr:D-alanyl-D-alanine carboxypeptidase/D-alanyl-D-alanine-endopeptidase [Candidatus Cybelea sp.]